MKIIILAAGVGSRLKPLTQNVPKSLLSIGNNNSVLDRTISLLNKKCNSEIIIVTGYYTRKIEKSVSKFNNCKIVTNPFYRITNSISSLWFAKEELNEDVIIMNADVILEESLIEYVIKLDKNACILYDSSIGDTADYKVSERDGKVTVMSKDLNKFSGEYVGVTKLKKSEALKLKKKIEYMINDGLVNEWYETALVDMIFNDDFSLDAVDVNEFNWTEIDNVNDLVKAREILSREENMYKEL